MCFMPLKLQESYSITYILEYSQHEVYLNKNLDKDVFHAIETASGYPIKSAWDKISYVNFCKLAHFTKQLIILGRLCLSVI